MTRLSNRQFPMLQAFAQAPHSMYMSIHDAQRYDQRPFRSMLIQGWIEYSRGRGFHITRKGRDAWAEFRMTEIWRKNAEMPLTRLFDPTAYGLKDPYKNGSALARKASAA
jgi:hypothetical protein